MPLAASTSRAVVPRSFPTTASRSHWKRWGGPRRVVTLQKRGQRHRGPERGDRWEPRSPSTLHHPLRMRNELREFRFGDFWDRDSRHHLDAPHRCAARLHRNNCRHRVGRRARRRRIAGRSRGDTIPSSGPRVDTDDQIRSSESKVIPRPGVRCRRSSLESMGPSGIEPETYGLKIRCSTY